MIITIDHKNLLVENFVYALVAFVIDNQEKFIEEKVFGIGFNFNEIDYLTDVLNDFSVKMNEKFKSLTDIYESPIIVRKKMRAYILSNIPKMVFSSGINKSSLQIFLCKYYNRPFDLFFDTIKQPLLRKKIPNDDT